MRYRPGRELDFDEPTDLTPEAEWLLQSRQASPALLAEELSREYFPFVYHFALALLDEPGRASAAARQALGRAVQNAYRYPGRLSVRAWLAGFVLQSIPLKEKGRAASAAAGDELISSTLDGSNGAKKAALLLRFLFGWPAAEVLTVPGLEKVVPLEGVDRWQEAERLPRAFQSRWPPPRFTEQELEGIAREVADQAGRRTIRQKRLNTALEVLVIGLGVLAAFLAGWGANTLLSPEATPTLATSLAGPIPTPLWERNVSYVVQPGDTLETIASKTDMTLDELVRLNDIVRMEPLYAGQPMWIAVPELQDEAPPPTPVTPAPPSEPLTGSSSPEEVRQAILHAPQHWHTLWADVQLISYPPPASDQARAYRFQAWVSQPGKSLELFNDLGDMPLYRHILLNGRNYTSAVLYSGSHLIPDWPYPPNVLLHSPLLREMFFPAESGLIYPQSILQIVNTVTRVAGRKALVVDVLASDGRVQYRLWVDARIGVILRCRKYDLASNAVVSDRVVTAIDYDIPIQPELFDPSQAWLGGFAEDASGKSARVGDPGPTPTWALPNIP